MKYNWGIVPVRYQRGADMSQPVHENLFLKLRKELRLTQVEVAQSLGCTQSRISKIEKGDVSLSHLRQLIEIRGGSCSITVTLHDKVININL